MGFSIENGIYLDEVPYGKWCFGSNFKFMLRDDIEHLKK